MATDKLLEKYYSDARFDGTSTFFDWVRTRATQTCRVLNMGAGPAAIETVARLKKEVTEMVGADIDPAVLTNKSLDRAFLIENGCVPIEDDYFDVVFSDFVLEHVEYPQAYLHEVSCQHSWLP